MFKYYISKDYRRTYDDLLSLGILSDSYCINFTAYQRYAKQIVLSHSGTYKHLQILTSDKPNPIKIIKYLLLVHALLQSNHRFDQFDEFYQFMNYILLQTHEMISKIKNSQINIEKKGRAKSAIFSHENIKNDQIQSSKQIFLLENVVKPYVLYLQKIVSIFSFYSSLMKTLYRSLANAQVWILLNLFKCAYSVTFHIPFISKFVRKTFTPVAQGLAEAFNADFNNFYPKLYRFIHEQCSHIQIKFLQLERQVGQVQAYRIGVQRVEDIANLLRQITLINSQLNTLYDKSFSRGKANIIRPKLIHPESEQFQFIFYLQKMKNCTQFGGDQTPKFFKTHSSCPPSQLTQQDKKQNCPGFGQLVPVFRDISNEEDNICTFRKENTFEQRVRIIPRYNKKSQNQE